MPDDWRFKYIIQIIVNHIAVPDIEIEGLSIVNLKFDLAITGCYRYLGTPTFFLSSALSTVPLSIGHNNQ